jgi:hypothetical protein
LFYLFLIRLYISILCFDINWNWKMWSLFLLHLLLAWQNYWMLIGWEEYNYLINCTAVRLMIFPKQTKVFWTQMWNEIALRNQMKIRTKAPNFALTRTKWKYVNLIKSWDQKLKKAKFSNLQEDWQELKRAKNKVTVSIRLAKKKFFHQSFEENSNNPKKTLDHHHQLRSWYPL